MQTINIKRLYVDGLIWAALTDPQKAKGASRTLFVLSGSTEEPDNTNGSKSNHQHKRGFWRQVEMRNLTYTLSPHSTLPAALTDPQKGGKRALTDLNVRSGIFT